MKILVVDKFGQTILKDTDAMPRLGDRIGCFYKPWPVVLNVLWWPDDEMLKKVKMDGFKIEAIVTVE